MVVKLSSERKKNLGKVSERAKEKKRKERNNIQRKHLVILIFKSNF